jgi:pimeloyl-ACP methyl ester carboxylesterase
MSFPAELSEEDRAYREETRHWQTGETGYSLIQGTRPQTPAYALTDSPTGLAAWIAEKLYVRTDRHGDLEPPVDIDWLLTNITLYWVTGAINSSFWPYYAVRHEPWPIPLTRSSTPTAYASFPREIRHPPRSFAEQVFNVQRWTEMPRGGHFAALEAPELLAADVATFLPRAARALTAEPARGKNGARSRGSRRRRSFVPSERRPALVTRAPSGRRRRNACGSLHRCARRRHPSSPERR